MLLARARAATSSSSVPPAAATTATNSEKSARSGSANDSSSRPDGALASSTSSATSMLPEYQRTSAPAERSSRNLFTAAGPEPIRATVPDARSRKTGRKRIGRNSPVSRRIFHIGTKLAVQIEKYSAIADRAANKSQLQSGKK